tara:strand:- start:333 stop:728 length:396 start_codon:yes stop_codon:yes gene_type:complete
MSTVIYKDAKLFVSGYNLSADSNELSLDYAADMLDVTTFGDDTRVRAGGLDSASISGNGFWNGGAGNADQSLFGLMGGAKVPLTVFADGITEGVSTDKGYAFQAVVANYNIGNSVGEMMTFDISAESAGTR